MARMISEADASGMDVGINPRTEPDPRFDPANDDENALAHEMDPTSPDASEVDVDEIQDTVKSLLEEAIDHYEETLEPDQVTATDYYYGRPFGDEKKNRSQVVSTDVRDATQAQIPSCMRIIFGPERVVEYRGEGPEDEAAADQATDYINKVVVQEDNPGFLTFHSVLKDGLVRRTGIVKWWWDEFNRVKSQAYTGLTIEEVQVLAMEGGELEVEATYQELVTVPTPDGQQMQAPLDLYDVRVTRTETHGRSRFAAVPPEEFVYTPNARSLDQATLVAHVREVAAEELIAMGVPEADVEDARGSRRSSKANKSLEWARQHHGGDTQWGDEYHDDDADESRQGVLYAECYVLIDGDGDGVAERRLFRCMGPDFEVINGDVGEIVDGVPFAVFTPDPEPHTIVGLSNYDYLGDVQKIKSQIQRHTLNSLAQSVDAITEVVQGEVNMGDMLSPDINKIVRVRRPGMMREVRHSFVGGDTLPVLQYWDEIKENRTGTSKAAMGLDADALQSSTKAAVAATLTASQQRIEIIVRVFAELLMKPLFRGLLELETKHRNRERVVRLRNSYVQVDPRVWDAGMDVQINVGLGQGAPEDRVMALQSILAQQKELLMAGSPLVSQVELRRTLGRAVELAGFRNSDEFFRPWGPEQEQALQQQMAQQPPEPDIQEKLLQLEAMKVQADAEADRIKAENERLKLQMEDDRERDKMRGDFALREYEIELKYKTEVPDVEVPA